MRLRLVIAVTATAAAAIVPSATAADPLLPDLGMAPLSDVYLAVTGTGQKQLRFSATIVNVGRGPFELAAARSDTSSAFSVTQRIHAGDGGVSALPTDATLAFAGDGHTHWHVRDLERYELTRLDNGVKVGTSAKSGFCFFDTTAYRLSLPGAPSNWVYGPDGCGEASSLAVSMGLSVGWGDMYPWTLPDQFVDVTDLAGGKYRLIAHADPLGWFAESREDNNATWVDIALTVNKRGTAKLRILGYGPTA